MSIPTPVRRRYPSDLTDDRWQTISSLLPAAKIVGRPRERTLREIVDAINYHWETGCAWRMLPHDFPPWGTVYAYFRKWQRMGVLHPVRDELLKPTPRERRNPQPGPRAFQNPDSENQNQQRGRDWVAGDESSSPQTL